MSTRNLLEGKGRPARRANNLTAVSRLSRQNVGASTSYNRMGLHGSYRDSFTFYPPGIFLRVKGGRRVGLTTLPLSVSRLSRQNVGASTSHNRMGLHGQLQG
jgi:hypothetical protein